MKNRAIGLILGIVLFSLFRAPAAGLASEKIFTIQVSSCLLAESAEQKFQEAVQKLKEKERPALRIEKIKNFYTVRIGSFDTKSEAQKYLSLISTRQPQAYLLEGINDSRRLIKTADPSPPAFTHTSSPGNPKAPDPETNWGQAKELANKGEYQKALRLLEPFISNPLDYPALMTDYLVILIWDKRGEEAIKLFEALPPSFPKRPYLLRNLGKVYYDNGEFSKALSLYQDALQQTPSDEQAQVGLTLSLIRTGQTNKASKALEVFLKENPHSFALGLAQARLLALQGQTLPALKAFRTLTEQHRKESNSVYSVQEELFSDLPAAKKEDLLAGLHSAMEKGDTLAALDHIWVSSLNKEYPAAIKTFEAKPVEPEKFSEYHLSWVAWAYFKTGQLEKARSLYQTILKNTPNYLRARLGLAYCLAASGEGDQALALLDPMVEADPDTMDIRFARAFVYEKLRRFWPAILEYDLILKRSPENPTARKLRLQALSDLGASSIALDAAVKEMPRDQELAKTLQGDLAVDRINWEEPREALTILTPLLVEPGNLRARFDALVALVENKNMPEAVKAYNQLILEKIPIPYWVLQQVASAYLYLEEPEKALQLYDKVLEENPTSFVARMGKFYTLQEMRKWKAGRELLDSLDHEIPAVLGEGNFTYPNWPKMEIALDRAWFLAYEGRLAEAEGLFWELRKKAPAHMGARTGLAQVYLWRGWPDRALREFNIVDTLDPASYKAAIGRALALNDLILKKEARQLAESLYREHPEDKHVQQLVRRLEVEDKNELVADFVFHRDEDGYEDSKFILTLTSRPWFYKTRFYAFLLWEQSSFENLMQSYRRAGLGITHLFNRNWGFRQHFSIDYDSGGNFGSYTQIHYAPDDYWKFSLSYDSYSTDIPLRARVFGITGDQLSGQINFRESDWRQVYLTLNVFKYSDGNERDQILLGYEQGLLVKNDWRMRLYLDLFMSNNTRGDAPYFNPSQDLSFTVTHLTELTHWRIYNQAFVQKLFLTLGTYVQHGYAPEAIWSVRYQQDIDFSDTQALLWGITYGRRVYDGDPVDDYTFYLTYRWRF